MQTTTQALNITRMQNKYNDPAFLARWLNGDLNEEELSSLRNREEYEEMMTNVNTLAPSSEPSNNVLSKHEVKKKSLLSIGLKASLAFMAVWLIFKLLLHIELISF